MGRQASGVAIAWTVSLAVFMSVLDGTVINVAISPMAEAFGADLSSIQWILTGYLLAQAAVIPVAGYFGLRWGLKRLFMTSLALFTLSSLLCGIAPDENWLVFFRVLQGLGGGALLPLAQAIALAAFPPSERASVSAIIGVSALLAPVFGPTLGGFLTDTFSWHAIFLVNIPVGIIAFVLAWRIIPPDPAAPTVRSSFDVGGLTLSMLGVLVLVYGLTLVSENNPATGAIYGWGAPLVWALIVAGLALLAGFVWYELRISDPVLDLRILTQREFSLGTLVACLVAVVVFGSLFMLPVFLQQIRIPNATATEAGLTLLPQGLGSAIAVLLSGRLLYNRIGPRMLILIGALLLAIGSWGLVNLTPESSSLSMLPWLVLRGIGFGFSFVPAQTFAMQRITGPALPKASSLLNMLRQIAGSVGTALVITTFVQRTSFHISELGPTNAVMAGSLAVTDVFWLVTIGALVVLFVGLTLPNRRGQEALGGVAVAAE
jgi:EmrB/QacA subfamily drug resistance transporter